MTTFLKINSHFIFLAFVACGVLAAAFAAEIETGIFVRITDLKDERGRFLNVRKCDFQAKLPEAIQYPIGVEANSQRGEAFLSDLKKEGDHWFYLRMGRGFIDLELPRQPRNDGCVSTLEMFVPVKPNDRLVLANIVVSVDHAGLLYDIDGEAKANAFRNERIIDMTLFPQTQAEKEKVIKSGFAVPEGAYFRAAAHPHCQIGVYLKKIYKDKRNAGRYIADLIDYDVSRLDQSRLLDSPCDNPPILREVREGDTISLLAEGYPFGARLFRITHIEPFNEITKVRGWIVIEQVVPKEYVPNNEENRKRYEKSIP